jgi:hypothetical protein
LEEVVMHREDAKGAKGRLKGCGNIDGRATGLQPSGLGAGSDSLWLEEVVMHREEREGREGEIEKAVEISTGESSS